MGSEGKSKGFYISKTCAAIWVVVVVIVLIAEGLMVGLIGRPTCSQTEVVTSTSSTTTTSTVNPSEETTSMVNETTTTGSSASDLWDNPRLPTNLIPSNYTVRLKPVLDGVNDELNMYVFYGNSTVTYKCNSSTNYVILHSLDLNYTEPLENNFDILDLEEGTNLEIEEAFLYVKNNYLVLRTVEPCQEGVEYHLTASNFWGELGDDLDGLYRSVYIDEEGNERVIATTQMESFGARQTFPCFDEPAMKAKFEITLLYRPDRDDNALSNMLPAYNETVFDDEGIEWTATTFQLTPVMSTYLLAMIVSDFTFEDASTADGIQTHIYARSVPVRNGEGEYAAIITPQILDNLAQHFNVAYPLNKSDQVAVPDFGAGAMENWGLVIYREVYLLYDELITSVYYKLRIVQVVSHELAHQWFGNLVTMEWWNDIWLNEGFATYVQYIGIKGVYDSWNMDELFIIDDLQAGLAADDSSSSHPLHHPQGYFSTVTYSKGGSVIRMIENFLGNKTFTNALTNYLTDRSYSVANYQTLFGYFAEEAERDLIEFPAALEEILETWVLQMGYPLLTVEKDDNGFQITQELFLIDKNDTAAPLPEGVDYDYKWYVPFTYKFASSLSDSTSDVTYEWMNLINPIKIPSKDEEFILANIDAVGFYRVAYAPELWEKIIEKMMNKEEFKQISPQNRAQLIDDVFALTRSEKVDVEAALNLTRYLSMDTAYIPWETFFNSMVYFDRMLASTDVFGDFSNYITTLANDSIYSYYGWDDTNTNDDLQIERMARGLAIETACHYGFPECIKMAQTMYADWMTDGYNISSTYRNFVYCAAIKAGGAKEWDFAWEQYLSVDSAQEKSNLRYALSCSKESWIINRYLDYAQEGFIRNQDLSSAMSSIGRHEHSKYVAWSYAVNNWENLTESVGSGAVDSLLSSAVRRFSSEFDLDLIESLRNITSPAWTYTLNSYRNTVIDNIYWRSRNEGPVRNWLQNLPPPTDIETSKVFTKYHVEKKVPDKATLFRSRHTF